MTLVAFAVLLLTVAGGALWLAKRVTGAGSPVGAAGRFESTTFQLVRQWWPVITTSPG